MPGGAVIASVTVAEDGSVTAILDTDTENLDELAGFVAANMLDETSRTAIAAWLKLHDDAEAGSDDDG